MNNSVTFGAKRLQTPTIAQYNRQLKTYMPQDVSFIELKPKNDNDMQAVKELTNIWFDASYIQAFFEDITEMRKHSPSIKSRFFAITAQTKNFRKPNSSEILGVAEINYNHIYAPYLDYLQVNPALLSPHFEPPFKGVGTGILNALKNMYDSITLNSAAKEKVTEFYEKNGFKKIDAARLRYKWIRK